MWSVTQSENRKQPDKSTSPHQHEAGKPCFDSGSSHRHGTPVGNRSEKVPYDDTSAFQRRIRNFHGWPQGVIQRSQDLAGDFIGARPRLAVRTATAEDNCLATSQGVCSSGLPTNARMYIDSSNA